MSVKLMLTGPRSLEFRETPTQPPSEGEVLLASLYTGISHGTEINTYRGLIPHLRKHYDSRSGLFVQRDNLGSAYPRQLGYQAVSEVVATGDGVTRVRPGDIVFSTHAHQTGAVLPEDRVWRLPDEIDPRLAVMTSNLNTTLNAMLHADVHIGETVAIVGLGVLGQLAIEWALMSGACRVVAIDLNPFRREIALVRGAAVAVDPHTDDPGQVLRELTDGRGADITIELTNRYAGLQTALRCAAPSSRVLAMSWYTGPADGLDLGEEFHFNCPEILCVRTGVIAPHLRHRWTPERRMQVAIQMIPRFTLAPLLTHVIPFENAAEAYEMIDHGHEEMLQIAFSYKDEEP